MRWISMMQKPVDEMDVDTFEKLTYILYRMRGVESNSNSTIENL